jgi:hypothetical protein
VRLSTRRRPAPVSRSAFAGFRFQAEVIDVDTIRAIGRARVWYNGDRTSGNYFVTGPIIPANRTAMTVDGDVNPHQHTGITVTNNETFSTSTSTARHSARRTCH